MGKDILAFGDINLIQDGPFWGCSLMEGAKKHPSP